MSDKKPIRIAQIIGKMWAGGVEAVVFNYYRAIDHSKVQFDFFYDADSTVEPPQELIDMGARFYKLPPYQQVWKYIPELWKQLRENNYTIVHSHLNTISVIPLFVAWCAKIPVRIAHNHSVPGGNEWKRNAAKAVLKKFSKVFATDYFACSEKAGRWLFGDKEYDNGNVTVIKNAIDFNRFKITEDVSRKLKETLGIKIGDVVFGHVGRFTYAKNHEKLLSIFKSTKMINPNAKLLLVGDGELRDYIKSKVADLGIADEVTIVGKVSNPEQYYSIMDVIILPSVFEGFSMTTIEAQIAGVPIVVSKAVPNEAIVSNAVQFIDINEPDETWAAFAEKFVGYSVELNEDSNEFDIKKCALSLQKKYLEVFKHAKDYKHHHADI